MKEMERKWNASFTPLIWGFALSVVGTLAAYFLVVGHFFSGWAFAFVLMGLGSLQALLQLILFLHVGVESRPRWNFIMFLFMVLVLVVVIGGSLWIMQNLNYRVMPMMPGMNH